MYRVRGCGECVGGGGLRADAAGGRRYGRGRGDGAATGERRRGQQRLRSVERLLSRGAKTQEAATEPEMLVDQSIGLLLKLVNR